MATDFYSVLNVDPAASDAELKKAYRKQIRVAHPDVGGSHEQFLLIQEAWTILGDPNKRAQYDLKLSYKPFVEPGTSSPSSQAPPSAHEDVYKVYEQAQKLYEEVRSRDEAKERLDAELYWLAKPLFPITNIWGQRLGNLYARARLWGIPYERANKWKTIEIWIIRGVMLALLIANFITLTQVFATSAHDYVIVSLVGWVLQSVLIDVGVLTLLALVGVGIWIRRWVKHSILVRYAKR